MRSEPVTLVRRLSDQTRLILLVCATVIAGIWPVVRLCAQALSQDAMNATLSEKITALAGRMDRIESMVNAVLIALIVNFLAQMEQIRRARERRH